MDTFLTHTHCSFFPEMIYRTSFTSRPKIQNSYINPSDWGWSTYNLSSKIINNLTMTVLTKSPMTVFRKPDDPIKITISAGTK